MARPTPIRLGWRLEHVIPCLLIGAFLVDATLRFGSIDPLTFRAWEAMNRYRPPGMVFEPNRRYYNPWSYGDLVGLGNLREPRQYRTDSFTTDPLGYRNAARIMETPVDAILAGDSFAAGADVGEGATLSAQLSSVADCVVYNAGSDAWGALPDRILAVANRLHMRHRLIIRLYAEDAEVPLPPTGWSIPFRNLITRMPPDVRAAVGRVRGFLTVSPLRILSAHALKALENDAIFPNKYAGNVVSAPLSNGDSMLFLASYVNNFYRRREIDLDYWTWLRDELHKARLDLLVVLVPGKYRVYRPYLAGQKTVVQAPGDYLDRLERELRAEGIPVFNLTPILSAEAGRYLRRGEYLYWLDDTHWNPRGISLAAAALRETWPLTETSCGTPRPSAGQTP